MVQSASSSKHHSPSGFWQSSSARVAAAMLRSRLAAVRRHAAPPAMTTSAARLPDRTAPSSVAGNPVAVQSPARTRLSHCVRAAGRLAFSSGVADEGRPPLAHDLPRRQFAGNSRRPRHLLPYRLGQHRARHLHQAVGIADRDRQPAREGEDPFGRAVDDAEHRRHAGRHVDAEMRVGDGAMALRHRQLGDERRRGMARHRQNDRIVGAQRRGLGAEIELRDPAAGKAHRAQLMIQPHLDVALAQMLRSPAR